MLPERTKIFVRTVNKWVMCVSFFLFSWHLEINFILSLYVCSLGRIIHICVPFYLSIEFIITFRPVRYGNKSGIVAKNIRCNDWSSRFVVDNLRVFICFFNYINVCLLVTYCFIYSIVNFQRVRVMIKLFTFNFNFKPSNEKWKCLNVLILGMNASSKATTK